MAAAITPFPGLASNGLVDAAQRRIVAPQGGLATTTGADMSSGMSSPFQVGGVNNPVQGAVQSGPGGMQNAPATPAAGPNSDPNWTPPSAKTFDFNPKYAQLDQANNREVANAQSDWWNTKAGIDTAYQTQAEQAQRLQKTAMQRLQERLAGQGILDSGINLEESGRMDQQYRDYQNNMNQRKAGDLGAANTRFAQRINNVSTAREGMWQNQADEQQQQQVEAARQQAEAQARAEEAARQQALTQQLIDSQNSTNQALLNRPQAPGVTSPAIGGVDPSAVYGSPEGQMRNYSQFLDYLNNLDLGAPGNYKFAQDITTNDAGLAPELKNAALKRIADYTNQRDYLMGPGRAY